MQRTQKKSSERTRRKRVYLFIKKVKNSLEKTIDFVRFWAYNIDKIKEGQSPGGTKMIKATYIKTEERKIIERVTKIYKTEKTFYQGNKEMIYSGWTLAKLES